MPHALAPPKGMARAAGGLLGVIGVEQPALVVRCSGTVDGSVTPVLRGLAELYMTGGGHPVPTEALAVHRGIHGPGWLLPVAVARPDVHSRMAETMELASAVETEPGSVGMCVAYVEMAAALFAGVAPLDAVLAATGRVPAPGNPLHLCGHGATDAVAAAAWTLTKAARRCCPGCADIQALVSQVSATGAASSVIAAAAGLLGLYAGLSEWPRSWHDHADISIDLAYGLLRARRPRPATARLQTATTAVAG